MKKLLLFTLSLGIATMSIGQAMISVDDIVEPNPVLVGNSSPDNTIKINMTNNGTQDYMAGDGYNVSFDVKMDGTAVSDPTGTGWVRPITFDFNSGDTDELILTQTLVFANPAGESHNLCVKLKAIYKTGDTQLNGDPNDELCEDIDFENPVGINDVNITEISSITTSGDVMNVVVKSASQQAQIKIMSITGQLVKTVNPTMNSNGFNESINIADLNSGVYIVTVQTENGVSAVQKVFVQ